MKLFFQCPRCAREWTHSIKAHQAANEKRVASLKPGQPSSGFKCCGVASYYRGTGDAGRHNHLKLQPSHPKPSENAK